ncbi:hypothetical protein EB241_14790 [Erwinia psidii]|uniref:Uncharacterized protein n=1 Tax=Erwinia psidii TaxID=69224 RepID=A0A3N6RWQ6_9GAMM|nr:hypothetical protein EB241_14790 [Erwinia psidii]
MLWHKISKLITPFQPDFSRALVTWFVGIFDGAISTAAKDNSLKIGVNNVQGYIKGHANHSTCFFRSVRMPLSFIPICSAPHNARNLRRL